MEKFICKIRKNKIKCTENANDVYSYLNLVTFIYYFLCICVPYYLKKLI